MKRDMDLVRKILLHIETEISYGKKEMVEIDGQTDAKIGYHIGILNEAGYVNAHDTSDLTSDGGWWVEGITWKGHELLDAMRNESVWAKAMRMVSEKVGSAPIDVLFTILKQLIIQQLEIPE